MALQNGDTLGPYQIQALIGEGGMGEVYRARDTRLDRTVAVKVSKAEFGERFEREARAVAALNHPHICTLHDVGPNYLVMEFIDGKPLQGPLAVDQVIRYAVQVADALDTAHRKGIFHRDLKPANILLTKSGIKLLDFGLAKRVEAPAPDPEATVRVALSQPGLIVGTPQYMSPEQVEGQDADARSDIFAFGAVLWELLTGKTAFDGKTIASVMAAVLREDPPPVSTLVPGISAPLERLIQRCLQKDPDERYQSIRDVKHALLDMAAAEPVSVAAKPKSSPSRGWQMAAVGALLAAMVFAVLYVRKPVVSELPALQFSILPPKDASFSARTGGAISPDGKMLAAEAGGELWLRLFDTGEMRKIAGTSGAELPFWSPDSREVAYWRNGKLMRHEISSQVSREIGPRSNLRGGTWNAAGVLIVAGGGNSGLSQIVLSDGSSKRLTRVNEAAGESSHYWPHFLPDGERFVYVIRSGRSEVSGVYLTSLKNPEARTRLLAVASSVAVVPPSAGHPPYLLFARDGALMAQALDKESYLPRGEALRVTSPVGFYSNLMLANFSASRTGAIVYGRTGTSRSRVTWLDRTGKVIGVVGEADEYGGARLSPTGNHTLLRRGEPTGNSSLWLLDLERVVMTKISDHSVDGTWSANGREFLFADMTTHALMRQRVDAGKAEVVDTQQQFSNALEWSPDGRLIRHQSKVLDLAHLEAEPARLSNDRLGRCSFAPDGKWIACDTTGEGKQEAIVLSFPDGNSRYQISSDGGRNPIWSGSGNEIFFISNRSRMMSVGVKRSASGLNFDPPKPLFPLNIVSSAFGVTRDGSRFLVLVPQEAEAGYGELTILTNWRSGLKKAAAEQLP